MGPEEGGPPAPSLVLLGRAQAGLHPHVHMGLALGLSPLSLGFLISEWRKAAGPPARPGGGGAGEAALKTLCPTEPGAHRSLEGGWRAGGVSSRGREWDPSRATGGRGGLAPQPRGHQNGGCSSTRFLRTAGLDP